jgi:hypothetical protein
VTIDRRRYLFVYRNSSDFVLTSNVCLCVCFKHFLHGLIFVVDGHMFSQSLHLLFILRDNDEICFFLFFSVMHSFKEFCIVLFFEIKDLPRSTVPPCATRRVVRHRFLCGLYNLKTLFSSFLALCVCVFELRTKSRCSAQNKTISICD